MMCEEAVFFTSTERQGNLCSLFVSLSGFQYVSGMNPLLYSSLGLSLSRGNDTCVALDSRTATWFVFQKSLLLIFSILWSAWIVYRYLVPSQPFLPLRFSCQSPLVSQSRVVFVAGRSCLPVC